MERATDSGSLADLLMKTAVDESWVPFKSSGKRHEKLNRRTDSLYVLVG